jgi:hypothetical protein
MTIRRICGSCCAVAIKDVPAIVVASQASVATSAKRAAALPVESGCQGGRPGPLRQTSVSRHASTSDFRRQLATIATERQAEAHSTTSTVSNLELPCVILKQ